MAKKYDRYELEIIISLGFLILFLISTNFISGFSFERAVRGQYSQFEISINMAANLIKTELEDKAPKWTRSSAALFENLQDLAILTDVGALSVTDTEGNVVAEINTAAVRDSENSLVVKRPLVNSDGKTIGYLLISSVNPMERAFRRLSRWDLIFRIGGLLGALIMGGYFLRAILYPYRRIKREAMDFNLDIKPEGREQGIEYIVDTFKDIILELEEGREQLENMYADSEKRADSLARYNEYILGSITSGVVICDSSGKISRFNPSAEKILQYFEKDCRGRHYKELFGANHKLSVLLDDALILGTVHSRLEFEIKRPDNEKLWLGCSSSMINDENGEGMGAAILMIDLTEIRRLQEISSYSEKMASLGEMSAGLAHEIRNSFAAVIGFANLVKKSPVLDKGTADLVDSLKNESLAAEALLSRFLNYARPLEIVPEPIDLRQLAESAIGNLSSMDNISLETRFEENLPDITGDFALLKQVLSNLLLNACDAVQGGGHIILEIKMNPRKNPRERNEMVISVSDNGIGIDPSKKEKIFEPFYTDKANGTGLGLALVKKIVILHRGRIEVHSKPGKGTRFTLYLPQDHCSNDSSGIKTAASALPEKAPRLDTSDKLR